MKNLPIGQQSIEKIIKNDFVYVDKTGFLYELVKTSGYYFLSRPRRFGKSLTCSTLEAIFQGKKELFKGLAISKTDYDWKKYPIVRLDFSEIAHRTLKQLEETLAEALQKIADDYKIKLLKTKSVESLFKSLVLNLADKYSSQVAIIIDEYDKPILDHIHNREKAEEMRNLLKSFYGILKGASVDQYLRFIFLTGVSKFSKVSIFSELNNLQDLTLDERTATLCGYTQEELELHFKEHIQAFAKYENKQQKQTLSALKKWYNGFQFSKNGAKVYNPFSILNCLNKKDFANYWFASGTPTFIMKIIAQNSEKAKTLIMLESEKIAATELESFSVETYFDNIIVLFLQAGYLTISHYNSDAETYSLCYPNYEVRRSMTEQILKYIGHIHLAKFGGMIERFQNALSNDDIEAFCQTMQDFFVILPITVIINLEKYYQGVFFTITKLIGANVDAEQATNLGYIDAVIEGKKNTYVIEFKKDRSPAAALKQIEDKKYFEKFKIEGKRPVVLVGMNFKYGKKGVKVNWRVKKK